MSAPKTDIEKQTRRHRPALIGIAIAAGLGALFFLLNMSTVVDQEGPFLGEVENDAAPTITQSD